MAWTEKYVTSGAAGGGDGSSGSPWTLAEAITNAAAGQRINVKADATYANTTTDRTFVNAGSTSTAIWWRGYNTTIGDIDADNSLAKPYITFTTGYVIVSGIGQWFSNLRFEGANTATAEGVFRVNAPDSKIWRCRFEGTAADPDCIPLILGAAADRSLVHSCYMKANAAADCCQAVDDTVLFGCVFEGGADGIRVVGGPSAVCNSIFINQAGHAINVVSTVGMLIANNSIYSPGGDGVRMSVQANTVQVCNNIFENCAYGVNSTIGDSSLAFLFQNAFFNNTSGETLNVLEYANDDEASFGHKTETSSPFTNAAGGDFSLVSGALSKAGGMPGAFENTSVIGYLDNGAVQRQEPAGGGLRVIGG
jgi:hypothetical protein